ncbi:hypothetical protein GUITHDRAFT_163320 [Guillardia theta CCMP2712]|uniref:Cilia- and flagella-associated protein 300 n=2 Tax=Guillardia theta TaxID=55529 RepID=L1JAN4_GUITC|nr:hypothetical protein GUITHDRAFT_163320 [Guillardia theta CCMP2712]EKX45155.1 hypothetical protein GUITHDRAFT_163320 [Guillardia theta CCMP2712]|mmetsp:Transcript_39049/g.123134  ORF Transcript_39049/g.123134 Transcript_39049/m.123134 type:complete len:271 (+) Transcript_39049:101-913(+)|eukprot:XP_005832135.1 hypothetical protein GUITHDRAFT_163320 [Guillardia theta CCMP2712]
MAMHISSDQVEEETSGSFQFEEVDFKPQILNDPKKKELWTKWGFEDCSYLRAFSFDEFFSKHQSQVFFRDFFASKTVQSSLSVSSGRDSWRRVGPVRRVEVEELASSVTNMEFFDKLMQIEDPPVVRENGALVKCFDEFVDDLVLSDELHKLLVQEESDHYEEFSEEERKELIFHIFKALVVGGGTCQFEDSIDAYMDVTKDMYKDLVKVSKSQTHKLQVTSIPYLITKVDADFELFPSHANPSFSFFLAIVEPLQRKIFVWYKAHFPPF